MNKQTPYGRVLRLVNTNTVRTQGYTLPIAWEAAVGGWLAWLRLGGISEATIRLRRDHIRSIARRGGTEHPAMLTKTHLLRIADKHKWSAEHRRSLRTSMNSFYEWAIAEQIVEQNPALCLPKVKAPVPRPRPTPDRVWEDLLTTAKPRERLMAQLAAGAGLRRGEIARLHCDDLIEDHDGWSLVVRGKGSKQRVVPITDRLSAEIRNHCRFGYVFPGLTDGHLSPQRVGEVLSRLMPEGWNAHSLRHRYATRGYAGTRDLRAVQEALGHASVRTTQIYTAISKRDVRLVSEAAEHRREPPQ